MSRGKLLQVFFLFLSFCLAASSMHAQLDSIVELLSKKNLRLPIEPLEEWPFNTGNAEIDSMNRITYFQSSHYYFHVMDSLASTEELITLTTHDSSVVQSYAAIALSRRDTLLLPGLLEKMLMNIRLVSVYGSVVYQATTASMLKYGVIKRHRKTGSPSQAFLDKMNSIYYSHPNIPQEDISIWLVHFTSTEMKPVIAMLAFERKNISAINYLHEWYKGEYYSQLNTTYFELLKSGASFYGEYSLEFFLKKLIDLNDRNTLKKAGGWLRHNREKWTGIKEIDHLLDESYDICDSIGWTSNRYPFETSEADFLVGDWFILSGIDNNLDMGDTVVLARNAKEKSKYHTINFTASRFGLSAMYYEKGDPYKSKLVATPSFDSKNLKICFGSDWEWYRILKEEGRVVLVRDK